MLSITLGRWSGLAQARTLKTLLMTRLNIPCVPIAALLFLGCGGQPTIVSQAPSHQEAKPQVLVAPPATSRGGFDGNRAFEHVRRLVGLGPRPPASDAIRRAQSYIIEQLKSYGCQVEEHDFHASTPIGNLPMKNIVAKISRQRIGNHSFRHSLRHASSSELRRRRRWRVGCRHHAGTRSRSLS